MDTGDTGSVAGAAPSVELRVVTNLCAPEVHRLRCTATDLLTMRPRTFIVDLSACPVIDGAGIDLLLDLHRTLQRDRGQLIVQAPAPPVRRLLQVARVEQVLTITPIRDEHDRRPANDAISVNTCSAMERNRDEAHRPTP
jgi:anti-anti-sigma factor